MWIIFALCAALLASFNRIINKRLLTDTDVSGVEGASVLVIPIKGSDGQIAIVSLDESRGFCRLSGGGVDNLQIVVSKVVAANRQGDYNIERLSIDYRDTSGESSLAFTTTMDAAEAYADGTVSHQQFMGDVDFNTSKQTKSWKRGFLVLLIVLNTVLLTARRVWRDQGIPRARKKRPRGQSSQRRLWRPIPSS